MTELCPFCNRILNDDGTCDNCDDNETIEEDLEL